jgi:hypothetical protein
VCSDFVRNEINYEELTKEEIINILSKKMMEKMVDIQESLEIIAEEGVINS